MWILITLIRNRVQCKKVNNNKRSENKINAFEYLNNDLFKVRMLMNMIIKTIRIQNSEIKNESEWSWKLNETV